MEQFRIVEVKKGNKIHYEIQKYCWFIFYYWSTVTGFDCNPFGYAAGNYPIHFKSVVDATEWIRENYPETRTVVKYINVS